MNSASIIADAEWLPHRYDETNDRFRFVYVPREEHRRVTFLTDEYLAKTDNIVEIPRAEIDAGTVSSAPLHFIFHSAYCCSTLAARMFDFEGVSMGLKEPVLLNDLVGWRRRGAPVKSLAEVMEISLSLLARPFAAGEVAVVKPSNIVNSIGPALLEMSPNSRALQLYAPIEDFLASIAVKGLWGRRWVREALIGQAKDRILSHSFSTEELLELTDLQIAGLGWLSNLNVFNAMRKRYGADRVAICDSVTLLKDPKATTQVFFRHFGIPLDQEQAEKVASGEAFTRNSKDQRAYSPEMRRQQLNSTLENFRDEIDMVAEWVRVLAKDIGIAAEPETTLKL